MTGMVHCKTLRFTVTLTESVRHNVGKDNGVTVPLGSHSPEDGGRKIVFHRIGYLEIIT